MSEVISASRRTDIPAFYADWLVNRLRAGSVVVLQPYSGRPRTVSLLPGDVSAIVFWSKNYAPLLSRLEEIERTTGNLFFHFTITGNTRHEQAVPDISQTTRDFLYLSRRYSPSRVAWRFDPLCITDRVPFGFYEEQFARCAEALQGSTTACIISFAHPYRKVVANLKKYANQTPLDLTVEQKRQYAGLLAGRAKKYGISLYACCNDELLSDAVGKAACIDGARLEEIFRTPIDRRLAKTRKECACTRSIDIGAYDTCAHACLYCYANADKEKAQAANRRHDPSWNSLGRRVDAAGAGKAGLDP